MHPSESPDLKPGSVDQGVHALEVGPPRVRHNLGDAMQTSLPLPPRRGWLSGCLATWIALTTAAPGLGDSARSRVQELPDQILVKARARVSEGRVKNVLRPMRGQQLGVIHQIGVRIIRVPADQRQAILDQLNRDPDIEFAEADALVAPDFTPNDPSYSSQWHLPKISAPAAWDLTTGTSNVIVAIIDSGVDATHPELAGLTVPGWNFYNNNSNTADVYGHGTSVAGTAIARGNNGVGIASVAWNCRIMPIRVSNTSGSATFSAMAQGLTYAADHGARVANVSYAGAARSATVQTAAAYLAAHGGLTVASSGNDGTTLTDPDNASILAVSSTTSTDTLSTFSTRGPFVDLSAPGSSIYTTKMGGGYRTMSGTSFAAPVVAGVAALMFSADPTLTPAEVETILEQTALDLGAVGYDTSFGWGRVNAYQAVLAALPAPLLPEDVTPPVVAINSPADGNTVSGSVLVAVEAADDTSVARLDVYVDSDLVASDTTAALSAAWDTATESNGPHTLTVVAFDQAGNSAQTAATVTVANVLDVTPPAVQILSPAAGATLARTQKVNVAASDASGVTRVDLLANGTVIATTAGNTTGTYTFSWNTSKLARGNYTLQAVAYDTPGNVGVSVGVPVVK